MRRQRAKTYTATKAHDMSKAATARVLTCEATGTKFEYKGVGRPPKYAPGIKRPRKPRAKKSASAKADAVAAIA
jgi:hypothetical protein